MIREKVVEGDTSHGRVSRAYTCCVCVDFFFCVLNTLHSVGQGVTVPISASGLKGLQPLRSMAHVGKGSRQARSVTSGEGLALRNVLCVCAGFVHALETKCWGEVATLLPGQGPLELCSYGSVR